jgi:hypothetical protein
MKVAFIILAIILILPLIIGLFLPSERKFNKTAEFKSSPQKVWDVITDIKGQEKWRDDVREIQMISTKQGGEKWTEIPKKRQPITFQTKTYQPPSRFDIEIVDSGFSGYWEGKIVKQNNLTKIEFKEVAIIKNPYYRVVVYLFLDLDKTMEVYLKNLKEKLGENG